MTNTGWTWEASRAHHEAAHAVTAHALGCPPRCSTIYDLRDFYTGGGVAGVTHVDCGDDHDASVIVALIAPIAQARFDSQYLDAPEWWADFRFGTCGHDRVAAQDVIKAQDPYAQYGKRIARYGELERRAREMLSQDAIWTAIEYVAASLVRAGTLDEEELARALGVALPT